MNRLNQWIETKDGRIIEAEIEDKDFYYGREVLYKSESFKLKHGEIVKISKGDVKWN